MFGLFVNVNSTPFQKNGVSPTSLNISKAALANVLQNNETDWSKVSDTSGNPIASSPVPIQIANREAGAGSRAAATVYFTGDRCLLNAATLADPGGATGDFFSTGNLLANANSVAGAITYASIDNFNTTTYPNLVLVNINGVPPSNLNAADGQYDYWFELTAQTAPSLTGNSLVLANWLIGDLQDINTESHLVDVNAIPGNSANDNPSLPISGTANTLTSGGQAIYVNQFTRAGSSCNLPIDAL